MDTGDTAAVAAVIVGIAAGLIALAALVVSYLAWKESRRSADAAVRSAKASEKSAAAAARSAVAEEAAIELARREAEQRDIDREDQAGPTFEPAKGLLREHRDGVWRAEAELRVEGGSDRMNVRVELVADTSFQTLHYAVDEQSRDTLVFNSIVPGGMISLCALPRLPLDGVPPLLLRVVATCHDNTSRSWTRRVRVDLRRRSRMRVLSSNRRLPT